MPPFPRLLLPVCIALAYVDAFAADAGVVLHGSSLLAGTVANPLRAPGLTHIEADSVEGHVDAEVIARGQVNFSRPGQSLNAEEMRFHQTSEQLEANGNIVFRQELNTVWGETLKLNLSTRLGALTQASYEIIGKGGMPVHGRAQTVHFDGPEHYRLAEASYTTCPLTDPDWQLKSSEVTLNYATSVGTARQVRVEYLNTPILYTPWMDFGLDDKRKSGFLAPSYGASDTRGLELATPWYWNIAPNLDATLTPHVMTKRGVRLGGELRYLQPLHQGSLYTEWLPQDRVARSDRYLGMWEHKQRWGSGWSWNVHAEHASDDQYFRDLSSLSSQTSQSLLPRQADIGYDAPWWNVRARVLSYQVLQDPAEPISEPYRRLPQLQLYASRNLFSANGPRFDLISEYNHFDHADDTHVRGGRLHVYPSLSWPLKTSYATLTPKLGVQYSRYDLDLGSSASPTDSLGTSTAGFASQSRSLPVASLDASLLMERDWTFLGHQYVQTLEPRAYYVYIPYRDQAQIPVFDTGVADLSLASLFSENQFIGVDRINDANQFTLAVTSRIFEDATGIERLQATLGQRYHFSNQQVTLRGTAARNSDTSDIVAVLAGQLSRRLAVNAGVQVNADTGSVIKANLGGAWRQGKGKLLNLDYRYISDSLGASQKLNQVDLSSQWPLGRKWSGLARINYSLPDSRIVEGLAGFEYNAGCWSLRGVMQRLVTAQNTTSSAFYLQLELRGLTMLGPNPLDVLKRSISGYAKSDDILNPAP
jgi:LPS-assembly protein